MRCVALLAHHDPLTSTSTSTSTSTLPKQGFFAANHRRLKLASLVNTAASLAACPAIVALSDASPLARVGTAAAVCGFGLGTTLLLHVFTKPYVHTLQLRPAPPAATSAAAAAAAVGDAAIDSAAAAPAPLAGTLRAETLGLFGGRRWTEFDAAEVEHPDTLLPLATFAARGRVYYVDKDAVADAALLAALTPAHPLEAEMLAAAAAAGAADEAERRAREGADAGGGGGGGGGNSDLYGEASSGGGGGGGDETRR